MGVYGILWGLDILFELVWLNFCWLVFFCRFGFAVGFFESLLFKYGLISYLLRVVLFCCLFGFFGCVFVVYGLWYFVCGLLLVWCFVFVCVYVLLFVALFLIAGVVVIWLVTCWIDCYCFVWVFVDCCLSDNVFVTFV